MATKRTTKAGEPAPTSTYEVLSTLDHDGVRYAAGDQVELTEADADELLKLGVVKPAKG